MTLHVWDILGAIQAIFTVLVHFSTEGLKHSTLVQLAQQYHQVYYHQYHQVYYQV